MIPEWCKKAAEEIERVPDCPNGYVLVHAPQYHIGLDVASGADRTVKAEFYAAEPVRELVEAARYAASLNCGCYDALNPEWHSNRCAVPRLRRALEPFKGVS